MVFIQQRTSSINDLVEETEDLTTGVLLLSLVVVHDTIRGGDDEVTELTGREEVLSPLLNRVNGNIETRRDDTALVDATGEVDDDLASALVVNNLELTNVTVLLHNLEELNSNLGSRADDNLTLTAVLGVGDVLEGVVEDRNKNHWCCSMK